MMSGQVQSNEAEIPDPAIRTSKGVLAELFGPPAERQFRVQMWNGSVDGPPILEDVQFTIILRRPGALRRMLLPPSELAIGEAYLRDDFDVLGSLEAATGLDELLKGQLRSPTRLAKAVSLLRALPPDNAPATSGAAGERSRLMGRRHSRGRDRVAVRSHYDVGNEFYALWLDRRMVYSCAYFQDENQDLDNAQTAKLDHICRKLRLKPGERLLDIGCGWGGLVQYAAEHYGVEAVGITLSEPQANLARERITAAGLSDRCRIEVRDYRDLPYGTTFDKIASVGMAEHVGRAKLVTYFDEVFRLLEPGGLFLNHGIVELPGANPDGILEWPMRLIWRPRSFIDRHVFPDGELLPLGEIVSRSEQSGFETRDVESLREHYALTLRHWVRRLEALHEQAARLVGEPTYRVWRLYMSGAARAFATGRLNVVQTLLSKPGAGGASLLPLTRADVYVDRPKPIRSQR